MLAKDLQQVNPNEYDVRFWYKEIALQLADINGNLYVLREKVSDIAIYLSDISPAIKSK